MDDLPWFLSGRRIVKINDGLILNQPYLKKGKSSRIFKGSNFEVVLSGNIAPIPFNFFYLLFLYPPSFRHSITPLSSILISPRSFFDFTNLNFPPSSALIVFDNIEFY